MEKKKNQLDLTGTWSAKPFISHDGLDENGLRAEVKVIKGFGKPMKIEPSDNGKSNKVSFAVGNTKYSPSGWTRDEKIVAVLEEAFESEEAIEFRIEVRRKKGIDRTTPIQELSHNMEAAKDNTYRSLAAVKKSDGDWIISIDAVTRFDEDPKISGPLISARDFDLSELQGAAKNHDANEHKLAAAGGDYSEFESERGFSKNPDGSVNPGSHAVEFYLEAWREITRYFNSSEVNPTNTEKRIALDHFIKVVNDVQLGIYEGKLTKTEYTAPSHGVAFRHVFAVMENAEPLASVELTEESLDEWAKKVTARSVALWKWAMKESEKYSE